MSIEFTTLKKLSSELKSAFQDKDWNKLSELDSATRSVISENALLVKNEADKLVFTRLLTELQSFYDELVAENIDRRSGLGSELKKLSKEHKAISQYLQSSAY